MFLRNILLAHKDRQHFVCVIEVKSQSFKWQSIGFMRCFAALALPRDIHRPFLVISGELLKKLPTPGE